MDGVAGWWVGYDGIEVIAMNRWAWLACMNKRKKKEAVAVSCFIL